MMRKAARLQRNAPVRQDVDPAETFHHRLEEFLDGRLHAHVDRMLQDVSLHRAQLLRGLLEPGRIAGADCQPRPFAGEQPGNFLADSLVPPGDHDDLPVKLSHAVSSLKGWGQCEFLALISDRSVEEIPS
jgi:hypothetical protein